MSNSANHSTAADEYDPVFVHSRREAIVIFCVWLACLCWAVPYCHLNGYTADFDPHELTLIWGMPSWVFWGILLPWMLATLFSIVFCLFVMRDDDLSAAAREVNLEAADSLDHDAEGKH